MLLDDNAQAQMLARLTGNAEQTEQRETSLETTNVPDKQEVKQPESSSNTEQRVEQPPIPYDRFKKVNETKKEYQRKFEEQQREMDKLRKELESKSSNQGADSWADDLLRDVERDSPDQKYNSLEDRVRAFELKEAEKDLANIVSNTQRKYNDLDSALVESVVYQAIAQDPDADIDEAVDRLKQFIDYVSVKGKKQVEVKAPVETRAAPPRPSMNGTKTYENQTSDNKPKTLADASSALFNYLRANKIK